LRNKFIFQQSYIEQWLANIMNEYNFMWWNVENLFDIVKSPYRSEKLERTLEKELTGWTQEILDTKIDQLSKIISKVNQNQGPDILGVCEIENRHVLELLVNKILEQLPSRNYKIVHADTQDKRGIDVAFIYDKDKFEVERDIVSGEDLVFSHFIMKREATRDILQVNFKTKAGGKRIVLIGNHWPSRSGGQYESEPYRIVAGETLGYFHQRILDVNENEDDRNTAILAMGDFNDEPFNRSITDYALSTGSLLKVKLAENPRFYNMMWSLMTNSIGTFYFNNTPNILDQFMISKGIVAKKNFQVKDNSTEIIRFPEMVHGKYEVPLEFGRPSEKLNKKGFSDHFPIKVTLEENL
jgi:predicted extracellular nuclease